MVVHTRHTVTTVTPRWKLCLGLTLAVHLDETQCKLGKQSTNAQHSADQALKAVQPSWHTEAMNLSKAGSTTNKPLKQPTKQPGVSSKISSDLTQQCQMVCATSKAPGRVTRQPKGHKPFEVASGLGHHPVNSGNWTLCKQHAELRGRRMT